MKNTSHHGGHIENIVLFSELHDVLTSLKLSGVNVIVLKGAALLETIYPEITARPLSDIDLLIKKKDNPAAQKALLSLGFVPFPKSHFSFIKKRKIPCIIDLHHDTLENYTDAQLKRVWQAARPATIAGVETLVLSHEENLPYLISHLAVLHGSPLKKWTRDIDLYVRYYAREIHWETVARRIKEYGLSTASFYTFKKVVQDYGTPLPQEIFRVLEPRNKNGFQAKLFAAVILREKTIPCVDYLIPIMIKPGGKKKLLFLLSFAFPAKEFMMNRYSMPHPWLIVPFYPARWISLIIKALVGLGGGLWKISKIQILI